jgi:hypothetical protein
MALTEGRKDAAAWFEVRAAFWEALFGNGVVARQNASAALRLSMGEQGPKPEALKENRGLVSLALALALVGDTAQAGKLADILARGYPLDTELNKLWLSEIHSVIKLKDGKAASAVDELTPAATYELGWTDPRLMPAYLRGQAYLALHRGAQAAVEFQKLVDHRGVVLNQPIGALAHLGLGRAYALEAAAAQGEQAATFRAKARTAYQDFLTLWKDADPDVPVLQQAKAESQNLK